MGGLLSSFWDISKNEEEFSCESETDSGDWQEEIEKEYGHPSWSQVIGKRLSKKKKVSVKVITCDSDNEKVDLAKADLASVVLSKEFKRLDSEAREELGVISETQEELDNVRNAIEELSEGAHRESKEIVEDNNSVQEDQDLNDPGLSMQVGMNKTVKMLYLDFILSKLMSFGNIYWLLETCKPYLIGYYKTGFSPP